jgi:hypothetical protein
MDWDRIREECSMFDASASNQHLRKEPDVVAPPAEEFSDLELYVLILEEWKWDFSRE